MEDLALLNFQFGFSQEVDKIKGWSEQEYLDNCLPTSFLLNWLSAQLPIQSTTYYLNVFIYKMLPLQNRPYYNPSSLL